MKKHIIEEHVAGISIDTSTPSIDITKPHHKVQVEYDEKRKVLYVHVAGITVLRICQIPGIEFDLNYK